MMKKFAFLLMLMIVTITGRSQEYQSQYTDAPADSRFQIVQSELGARYTFNLDKYTGNVFMMVRQEGDALTWQLIDAEYQDHDEKTPDQVNYQLFLSGLGVRYMILLNVNTGVSWQFAEDKRDKSYFWAAMK